MAVASQSAFHVFIEAWKDVAVTVAVFDAIKRKCFDSASRRNKPLETRERAWHTQAPCGAVAEFAHAFKVALGRAFHAGHGGRDELASSEIESCEGESTVH